MPGQHVPISWWPRLCRWLWKYPLPFLFSTLIINIAINIGSTWLITPATTKTVPDTSIAGNITGWVSAHWVFSLILSATSIALLLVTWRGSREAESTPVMPRQVQMSVRDRERMLRRLHVRYEQLLAQSLQGAVQIELGLTSRPAAIRNAVSLSLRLPEQPEQALPAHTSILDAYNLAQQELLILGEPGAGKSTLLLELAQHLVNLAEQDAVQPLPVVLQLSSWATKRLPLQEWLIEQFALSYDIPRQFSHDWIQAELVLPFLDGLDEMEESARPGCIAAVNTYHSEHFQPLVVCSRTNEYNTAAQHERIALHTAIVVQPLTRKQVDAHLATIGRPLTGLRTALKKNATLQILATTPLLLHLLVLVYHGIPVRALSHKEDQLREQIWSNYVQQRVNCKGNSKHYPLKPTCHWLGGLARYMRMHNQNIFYLEHLQPDWLPKGQMALYQWVLRLLLGPLLGLLAGLFLWLLLGSTIGLFLGLGIGLLTETQMTIEHLTETLTWSWKGLRNGLLLGLPMGLTAGLLFGMSFGLPGGLMTGHIVQPEETLIQLHSRLLFGLPFGLLAGLLLGLLGGFSGRQLTERERLLPNEGIWHSLKNGLILGLLGAPVIWLILEVFFGPLTGLLAGLLFVLLTGVNPALLHYLLRIWLWRNYSFPLQAVPFLEDARDRNLLLRVGGGYTFLHRELLDYFAELDMTTAPASTQNPHPVPPPSAS